MDRNTPQDTGFRGERSKKFLNASKAATEFQKQGIARDLINHSLDALSREGIRKCNTFVEDSNVEGSKFWKHMGFRLHPDDFHLLQRRIE